MKLTTWLSRAFPLERRPAAGGLLSGFLLAVVLWLPLPEAVSIPAWLPPVLLLAALAVLLVLYAAGRPLLAPPMSWDGGGWDLRQRGCSSRWFRWAARCGRRRLRRRSWRRACC